MKRKTIEFEDDKVFCIMQKDKLWRMKKVVVTEDYEKCEGCIQGEIISVIDIPREFCN